MRNIHVLIPHFNFYVEFRSEKAGNVYIVININALTKNYHIFATQGGPANPTSDEAGNDVLAIQIVIDRCKLN